MDRKECDQCGAPVEEIEAFILILPFSIATKHRSLMVNDFCSPACAITFLHTLPELEAR